LLYQKVGHSDDLSYPAEILGIFQINWGKFVCSLKGLWLLISLQKAFACGAGAGCMTGVYTGWARISSAVRGLTFLVTCAGLRPSYSPVRRGGCRHSGPGASFPPCFSDKAAMLALVMGGCSRVHRWSDSMVYHLMVDFHQQVLKILGFDF
jgi:hypothetical protein